MKALSTHYDGRMFHAIKVLSDMNMAFFFFVFKHIYIFYVLQIHSIGRYEGYR